MDRNKGFTLVELLIALGIVALLITIVTFSISVIERNKRNTIRRKAVSDIILLTNSIRASIVNFPSSITTENDGVGCIITFYDGANILPDTFSIPNLNCNPNISLDCKSTNFNGEETTQGQISICYDNYSKKIGAKLENNPQPFISDM